MVLLIFIFGILFGSFLNCFIYRLEEGKSIWRGRSHCTQCKHQLGFLDLFPILSFVCLKGRCKYCKKKISFQYPLVEFATGFLFVLVFIKYFGTIFAFQSLGVAAYLLLFRDFFFISSLIIIFVYDLKHSIIPDKITLPAIAVAFIFNILLGFPFTDLALSAIIGGGFFFLQFFLSKGKWIGAGDIRLGVLIGIMLSWPFVLAALIVSYIIGGVVSLVLLTQKKWTLKSKVPLGPFLVIGTVLTLLYGQRIIEWYIGVFGT